MTGQTGESPITEASGRTPYPAHREADVLVRLGAMAEDLPEIAELDCNPIVVHEHRATIVDARIRVEPAEPPRPLGARR